MSEFIHAQSCDPVFVQDDIAFVTLRDGNQCQGFTNQLEVIDVTDMRNPQLIAQYPMLNPHGLSVSETNLYLCEGSFGFKVFNKEDVTAIDKNLLTHETGIHGFDVIVLPGEEVAIVVGQEGLVQYDIADRSALKELSRMDTSCN